MSNRSGSEELEQVPRHSPQLTEQSKPLFLQVHLLESQLVLQLHLTVLRRMAGGLLVLTGNSFPDDKYHPHWHWSKFSPVIQYRHCKYARLIWKLAASAVGGKLWTWADIDPAATLLPNFLNLRISSMLLWVNHSHQTVLEVCCTTKKWEPQTNPSPSYLPMWQTVEKAIEGQWK